MVEKRDELCPLPSEKRHELCFPFRNGASWRGTPSKSLLHCCHANRLLSPAADREVFNHFHLDLLDFDEACPLMMDKLIQLLADRTHL